MRYYLDANILIFVLGNDRDELSIGTMDILEDYSNRFYLSTVAIREVILLYKEGKLEHLKYKTYEDLFIVIDELGYEIKPVVKKTSFYLCRTLVGGKSQGPKRSHDYSPVYFR